MAVADEIFAAIKTYNKIIIHRHQRPDPDAIGSQIGLATILKDAFPTKQIMVTGKKIDGFNWIGEMDDVDDEMYNDALVMVVDTANVPRIDDRRFDRGDMLIKIDHHPNDEPYGDLMWVVPEASSSSELVVDFAHQFPEELTINRQAAHALLAGIVGDTGRFLYPATSPHTLAVAGQLVADGADLAQIGQREDEISEPIARLSAYLYANLEINADQTAFLTLANETLQQYHAEDQSTAALVPLPGQIQTVTSWAIFVEQDDHTYRVRMRSKGPAINEIAKQHNGGGHELASGAKARNQTEIDRIKTEYHELMKRYEE